VTDNVSHPCLTCVAQGPGQAEAEEALGPLQVVRNKIAKLYKLT